MTRSDLKKSESSWNLESAAKMLQSHFRMDHFLDLQKETLGTLFANKNSLLLLPTGGGKSLCYQLPSILTNDLVLVISPLIALMDDQLHQAKKLGLRATFINSSLSKDERDNRLRNVCNGKFNLLFVTPERFRNEEFVSEISKLKIALFVVDEAHCVSLWGHDFRPDYSKISEIRAHLGNPLTLALTATATPVTQKDILEKTGISDAVVHSKSFARQNISLSVHEIHGYDSRIRALVGLRYQTQGPLIIYSSLISTVISVHKSLFSLGIRSHIYHGDLQPQQKRQTLDVFLKSDDITLIATPAFGLGINKPNIRSIIHFELPSSIEAFYQEVGRSGRDGLPANSHLLYDPDDMEIQREFINWGNPDPTFLRTVYRTLETRRPEIESGGLNALKDIMSFRNRRDYRVEASLQLLERIGSLNQLRAGPFPYELIAEPTEEMLKSLYSDHRRKNSLSKLLEMVRYASLDKGCRMQTVLEYFGETHSSCGICDLCKNST